MCVVSNVMDHYENQFRVLPYIPPEPSNPVDVRWFDPFGTQATELRNLISEFREAVAAAKVVDRLTNQPDCEDPEKVKLVARVAELEAMLRPGVWVIKLGDLYWGRVNGGYIGWVAGQNNALRYGSKEGAKTAIPNSRVKVVRLVKRKT